MPIGTSLGAYFEDSFHHQAGIDTPPEVVKPKDTGDDNTAPPDPGSYDQPKTSEVSDKRIDVYRGTPPEAPAEPAGALNSPRGTEVPAGDDIRPTPDYLNPPDRDIPPVKDAGPRDASQDIKVNPWVTITPEDINNGIDVAMSVGAGTMQGVKGATFNKAALYKAQELEMGGEHPDSIWDTTGTFRGADNHWRQEIDDSKMNLKPEIFEPSPNNPNNLKLADKYDTTNFFGEKKDPLFLKDVIDHPELFKAYPHLQNIKVEPVNGFEALAGYAGAFREGDNTLKVGRLPLDEMKKTILHETQHAIQAHEGFSRGSSSSQFILPEVKEFSAMAGKARDTVEKSMKKAGFTMGDIFDARYGIEKEMTNDTHMDLGKGKSIIRSSYAGVLPVLERVKQAGFYEPLKNVLHSEKLVTEYTQKAKADYLRTMGEVEARNVESRMKYTDWNRSAVPPLRTEDHGRLEQIASPLDNFLRTGRTSGSQASEGPFTPYSRRWPNNDNAKPLNEHEQYIKMYDDWHAFGERMNPKSELDTNTYNKMGKAIADWQSKTYGYDVPYEPIKHDPLNTLGLRKD